MTSITKSVLDNGGVINRNGKRVVTARQSMLPMKGTCVFYTIRQKKERLEAEVTIKGNIEVHIGTGTYLVTGTTLPEVAVAAIAGTPLRRLIDHPLIPEDIIITSARNSSRGIAGEIRGPTFPWKSGEPRMQRLQNTGEIESRT